MSSVSRPVAVLGFIFSIVTTGTVAGGLTALWVGPSSDPYWPVAHVVLVAVLARTILTGKLNQVIRKTMLDSEGQAGDWALLLVCGAIMGLTALGVGHLFAAVFHVFRGLPGWLVAALVEFVLVPVVIALATGDRYGEI